jgi:uncharacterized membrane protein
MQKHHTPYTHHEKCCQLRSEPHESTVAVLCWYDFVAVQPVGTIFKPVPELPTQAGGAVIQLALLLGVFAMLAGHTRCVAARRGLEEAAQVSGSLEVCGGFVITMFAIPLHFRREERVPFLH